jgi:hypothetical protein
MAPNPRREQMETMNTVTPVKSVRQTHPEEVLARTISTADDKSIVPSRFMTGVLIGCPISLFLWVGIIVGLSAIF